MQYLFFARCCLAHSHILCNSSSFPPFARTSQAVLPISYAVDNSLLFISSVHSLKVSGSSKTGFTCVKPATTTSSCLGNRPSTRRLKPATVRWLTRYVFNSSKRQTHIIRQQFFANGQLPASRQNTAIPQITFSALLSSTSYQ
jgi:hypothetical protein